MSSLILRSESERAFPKLKSPFVSYRKLRDFVAERYLSQELYLSSRDYETEIETL